MDMRERIARALCEADGCDPDHLEPGDDPYQNDEPVIDGRNRKGEPCHLFWRRYDRIFVDAVLDAMMEPTGYETGPNDECEGMMRAGLDAYHMWDSGDSSVYIVGSVYTAMLTAARTPAKD